MPRTSLVTVAILLGSCLDLAGSLAAPPKPPPVPAPLSGLFHLERVARASQPVFLAAAPGDASGRLFIVEKGGRVRILRGGELLPTPFLDLSREVSGASEQGLLGLAFHPRFADNGRFVVNHTDRRGDTRVVEYRVAAGAPDRADPASARELLFIDQPYANHNGGDVRFGPDGKLYVGTGDGGSANDPKGHGQNRTSLLGKMLRIDVDAPEPRAEIVAVGLRNPWRNAFDPVTAMLYIADVGQSRLEEVHVVPLADLPGKNFGWNVLEGSRCLSGSTCARAGMTPPVVEYDHGAGCSITGGVVYRGKALPELSGIYFYADYCTALLRGFRFIDGAVVDHWDWKAALDPGARLSQVTSFGEDADGELYVLTQGGPIFKLVRRPAGAQRKK
jgi:glucose/arabinose dehydrogenase